MVFAKITLILGLVPSLLASSHVTGLGAGYAGREGRTVSATTAAQKSAAAARAIERKLLLLAPGKKALRRFVDRTTGVVRQNVAAHCTRYHGKRFQHIHRRFLCHVWTQPRPPSSGIAVLCFTKRHVFRVTPYHRRHRHHRARR